VRKASRCVRAPLLAVCAGLCLVVVAPQAGGAERGASSGGISAALELYSLDAELAAARAQAATLAEERRRVTAELGTARVHLRLAETALATAQVRLARIVRRIYAADQPEPLAVVLGAQSFDEAQAALDALERSAAQNRAVGRQAGRAQAAVGRLARQLAARKRLLAVLEADARGRSAALVGLIERRRAYLATVSRRRGAAAAAAAARRAASAQRRSETLATAAAPPAAPALLEETAVGQDATLALRGVRRLTVDAVAYSLKGRTASGLPVGHGVAAVDPAVIPLGTRMHVPGYGTAVAADVGSAVKGLVIDLWFPTLAEAQAWGRRTVTITLL
jgi:3D (Asp-Asp-Asp) domain-containing protein